MIFMLVPSA